MVKLCKVFDCSIAYLTDTKEREPGDVSLDDVMLKIATLDRISLGKLYNHIMVLLQAREEYDQIIREKAEMERKLKEYEDKLKTIESYGIRRE